MALKGFGKKSAAATAGSPTPSNPSDEEKNNRSFYGNNEKKDVEGENFSGRKGSRISKPRVGSTAMGMNDDDSINVGKQIELEEGNAIKYRTCSWQKVCDLHFHYVRPIICQKHTELRNDLAFVVPNTNA